MEARIPFSGWVTPLLLVVAAAGGCKTMNEIKPHPALAGPPGNIPLRAGLYLSPVLCRLQVPMWREGTLISLNTQYAVLGPALAADSETVVRRAFQHAVLVNSPDPTQMSPDLDVLVIPEPEQVGVGLEGAVLRMRWTVKNRAGRTVYLNSFRSAKYSGYNDTFFAWEHRSQAIAAMDSAMEEQFNKAFAGMTTSPWYGRPPPATAP
ncbi:MAG: hypothetical protein ABR964_06755 [Tepidisphaeraceae bacterium]|jgi:hypothetical protein